MTFEEIHTNRLILRKLTQDSYVEIFETHSKKEIKQILGLSTDEAYEKEKLKYQKGLSTHNKTFLYFQLINRATGEIIGWCGYHTWYIDHKRAELGYGMYADLHKRLGLMTEAIHPILKYGFEQMNLNRIEAFIGPNNVPSLNLIKKINFTEEGRLRAHYIKNMQVEDSLVFSLLRGEFS